MSTKLAALLAGSTLIVLFGLPKAGIYVNNIPITFSYLLLGLTGVAEIFRLAGGSRKRIETRYLWLMCGLMGLTCIELYSFRVFGHKSLGIMISVLVSTIMMPVLGILAAHWMIRTLGLPKLISVMRWALGIVLVFGVVSFMAFNVAGIVLGVPYVTTTGSDITLVAARHNLRGPIIKMFSTYNNGNILGINMLIWGPILAITSLGSSIAYRTVCLLTLSRSVWVGLIGIEFFGAIEERSYRRVYQAFGGAIVLGFAVIGASIMIGRDPMEFLLDRDLGGRVTSLQNDLEVMSRRRIGWDSESVPAAAWLAFGPVGLMLMAVIWFIPIVCGGVSAIQKTARISLLVYLIVSCVEGAFTLVPTQAIYWFVAAIAMASPELLGLDQDPESDEQSGDNAVQEEPDSGDDPAAERRDRVGAAY